MDDGYDNVEFLGWVYVCDECGRREDGNDVQAMRGWLELNLVKGVDLPFEMRQVGSVCGVFCGIGCVMERVRKVAGWIAEENIPLLPLTLPSPRGGEG